MPTLLEPSHQAHSSAVVQSAQTPSRLLSRLTGAPLTSITDGLAQVLGSGQTLPPAPQMQGASMVAQLQPLAQAAPPPVDRDTASMTVEQLLHRLQPSPDAAPVSEENLDTLRMQMFGRYYQEIEARMIQLSQATEGGVARARRAMLERVDELGAALHRDMVAMRQEMQREVEELKRDVFTTVMSLSAINDKLSLAESRNRETWVAVTKALTDRIDSQAKSQGDVIEGFRKGIDEGMEQRVVALVESTLMRLAAVRRAPPAQGTVAA